MARAICGLSCRDFVSELVIKATVEIFRELDLKYDTGERLKIGFQLVITRIERNNLQNKN